MNAGRHRRIRRLAVGATLAAAAVVPGCRRDAASTRPAGELNLVCTFLPVYVFTRNVIDGVPGVQAELLVSKDAGCPHHYSLRPLDLKRVARADLIVANGLGLEPFLDDVSKAGPHARVITISDDCDVLHAETEPGHDESPGHAEHGHEHAHEHAHAHEHCRLNAHVWVSPTQAARQVETLARKLGEADPAHAAQYARNAEAYIVKLRALDQKMRQAAQGFARRRIATLHDAFAYLARDLGLEVVATLQAEPGQEPSASGMTAIIDAVRKAQAVVFYEPGASDRVARTVARDAGVPVFPLNPFNTFEGEPTASSYESVMLSNLDVLRQALGAAP